MDVTIQGTDWIYGIFGCPLHCDCETSSVSVILYTMKVYGYYVLALKFLVYHLR